MPHAVSPRLAAIPQPHRPSPAGNHLAYRRLWRGTPVACISACEARSSRRIYVARESAVGSFRSASSVSPAARGARVGAPLRRLRARARAPFRPGAPLTCARRAPLVFGKQQSYPPRKSPPVAADASSFHQSSVRLACAPAALTFTIQYATPSTFRGTWGSKPSLAPSPKASVLLATFFT